MGSQPALLWCGLALVTAAGCAPASSGSSFSSGKCGQATRCAYRDPASAISVLLTLRVWKQNGWERVARGGV